MLEAFFDVFSLTESEFVDPILNLIRDDNSEFHRQLLVNEDDVYLLSRHLTSKVNIYFYGLFVFMCSLALILRHNLLLPCTCSGQFMHLF